MFFGSVCSGIEAASVAWKQIGWKASWLAEIEPFPSDVLEHHYPDTQNLGDMTKIAAQIKSKHVVAPDVLVGGTPCQAFSVAGMRDGLADPRGELTIRYVELADAIDDVRRQRGEQPAIIVWENVPGVLSSKDNAFGCFLGALAGTDGELQPTGGGKWASSGCVYGPQRAIAWRVLDAQYFGLAQRRKRVFLVASARDGFDPSKILFEFEGVRRDSAPSRETGQETAVDAATSSGAANPVVGALCARDYKGVGNQYVSEGKLIIENELSGKKGELENKAKGFRMVAFGEYADDDSASTMKARDYKDATDLVCVHGTQDPIVSIEHAHALGRNGGQENAILHGGCLTQGHPQRTRVYGVAGVCPTLQAEEGRGHGVPAVLTQYSEEMAGTLTARHDSSACPDRGMNILLDARNAAAIQYSPEHLRVRRLTPVECERLQGFPDNYTQIEWKGKPADECPDGHRYKALGNSMAVPCMIWIGKRIQNLIEE